MSSKTPRPASNGKISKNNKMRKTDGSPPRRRSARLSANEENVPKSEARVLVKRSITVKKIVPRKTQVPSVPNKENVDISGATRKRPEIPGPTKPEAPVDISGATRKRPEIPGPTKPEAPVSKSIILSPIQATASPPPPNRESKQDPAWSHKVRRSYSRLSMGDHSLESPKPQSTSSPTRRETLFGFERLQTPEVRRKADVSRGALQSTSSLCGGSFNLSAAEDSVSVHPELDLNIPGVCLVKNNTRRKRVQQIKMSELDILAAKMNAEFEEAECFELVVE